MPPLCPPTCRMTGLVARFAVAAMVAVALVTPSGTAVAAPDGAATSDQIRDRILTRIDKGRLLRAPQITGGNRAVGGGPGYESVIVGGQVRLFQRYTPSRLMTSGKPAPVVFVLHPDGGRADAFSRTLGLNRLAETDGFIAVYPQASGPRWANPGAAASKSATDDAVFLERLADALIAQRIADPDRIFLASIGNATNVTLEVACSGGARFKAFGLVTGQLKAARVDRCRAASMRSIVISGALAEEQAAAATTSREPADPSSVLAVRLGCTAPTVTTASGKVARTTWSGCRSGNELEHVRAIERIGLDGAAAEIWNFFKRVGR